MIFLFYVDFFLVFLLIFLAVLKKGIAMAYVESGKSSIGTAVKVEVRGKMLAAQVSKMPFVKQNYYKKPAEAATGGAKK